MQIYSFIKVTKRMKFTEDLYHLVEYYNEYVLRIFYAFLCIMYLSCKFCIFKFHVIA